MQKIIYNPPRPILNDAKNVAEASAKSMVDFKKMYGDALVDVAELAEQVKAA